MTDNNITIGEDLSLQIHYTRDLSDAVLQYYNRLALVNGWPTDQTRPIDSTITGSCQIAGKLSETYGKYPVSSYQSTLLMEYDTFLQWAVEASNNERPAQFNTWIDTNPEIL